MTLKFKMLFGKKKKKKKSLILFLHVENKLNQWFQLQTFLMNILIFFACANRCSHMKIAYLFVNKRLYRQVWKFYFINYDLLIKYWSNLVIESRFKGRRSADKHVCN